MFSFSLSCRDSEIQRTPRVYFRSFSSRLPAALGRGTAAEAAPPAHFTLLQKRVHGLDAAAALGPSRLLNIDSHCYQGLTLNLKYIIIKASLYQQPQMSASFKPIYGNDVTGFNTAISPLMNKPWSYLS